MNNENTIVGGVSLFLAAGLIALMNHTVIEQSFDSITDKVSDFLENTNNSKIEAFGDQMGSTMVRSTGPPVGGTQAAAYQLYQQAVNAATPTVSQLENISNLPGGGYGFVSSPDAPGLVPPAGKGTLYDAAAVDFGNRRAEMISPCAQNAPTFVASSLLPKINLPGVPSWSVMDTQALASQDFLSPVQQFGVDTVLSSLRNPSYDLRNNIPNPINVVSPFLNSTITPDLERRSLDTYVPEDGVYGSGTACNYKGPLSNLR